jgi:hypothetical protein
MQPAYTESSHAKRLDYNQKQTPFQISDQFMGMREFLNWYFAANHVML